MAIPPKATPLEGIKLSETTEDNAAPYILVQDTDGVIKRVDKAGFFPNDFLQQPFLDFSFNTPQTTYPMTTAAFGAGTLTTQSDSITPGSLRTSRPHEIIEAWGIKGNASTANGGHSVSIASQNPIYVGSCVLMAVQPSILTDTLDRIGLVNQSVSPLFSPVSGMYIEIDGNSLTFRCTNVSMTSSGTSATLLDTSWLFVMFEVESLTAIRCKVRKGSISGDLIYEQVVTNNLPISVQGSLWNQLRVSMVGIRKIASAETFLQLGRAMTFAKKPNYLKNF